MIALSLILTVQLQQTWNQNITADALKKHVEYLASDELEGRGTPSKGLDMAADYIAAELKAGGVSPGNGASFFQETTWRTTGISVRNVVGLIPGTDEKLKDSYLLVTAHYDHLGMAKQGTDLIYNGANDNASSTSGIIEIGKAMVRAKPKRSVVIIAFYGEEKGLVGAEYYTNNPVFPLKKTIANVNLEQIGRTDDAEGARVNAAVMTGYDFSDLGSTFTKVGTEVGVPVSGHPQYSAPFFMASDNFMFALKGIPCATLCTAFEFPDYHQVSDHADKLDYSNMANVTRMIAHGVLKIANNPTVPVWNKEDKRTKRYIEAQEKLNSEG